MPRLYYPGVVHLDSRLVCLRPYGWRPKPGEDGGRLLYVDDAGEWLAKWDQAGRPAVDEAGVFHAVDLED